jgi:hypothetical protein
VVATGHDNQTARLLVVGRTVIPPHVVHDAALKHNWFMSTALSEADVGSVLVATDAAVGQVAKQYSLSEQ